MHSYSMGSLLKNNLHSKKRNKKKTSKKKKKKTEKKTSKQTKHNLTAHGGFEPCNLKRKAFLDFCK